MTKRERIIEAINHRQPDKVPLDLGGCPQTGINASTLYKLRSAYGLPSHPIDICELYQMLGDVEFDLLELIGADVLPLYNPGNAIGVTNKLTQKWIMPDGTPVMMAEKFTYSRSESGDIYAYPCSDRKVQPSLHMPAGGSFFDAIDRSPDFDEDNLTPLEDYKDSFPIHSEEDCIYWENKSKVLFDTDYAVLGVLGGGGFGDVASLPGPALKAPRGIRRIQDWMMAHILYPDYIKTVFEMQLDAMLTNLSLYKQAVGERIQIIWISGTDFGTQISQFMSNETFIELYKPYYKRVNDWVHENTQWKTFFHCCGAIFNLIPEFIDMGVDILNPVQCSAAGMDANTLKDTYGDRITFWGGGINTQQTLPYGTPEEVRQETLARVETFSKNGGFVFSTIHNIVAKTPIENIVTMFETFNEAR